MAVHQGISECNRTIMKILEYQLQARDDTLYAESISTLEETRDMLSNSLENELANTHPDAYEVICTTTYFESLTVLLSRVSSIGAAAGVESFSHQHQWQSV